MPLRRVTKSCPDSDTGLFKEYIDTFLKVKQQSSGFPEWCMSEELKMQYIADYKEIEGIELEYEKIVQNDSERARAKELLNNVWGFFSKKPNKPITEIVQDALRFHEILTDESCSVLCKQINSENLLVKSTPKKDFVDNDIKTNVVIAVHTTMYARLKLHEEILDKLQERALYCDTDSTIFLYNPYTYNPPLGDFLGHLTSVLKPGQHITEFACSGAKNYTCKVVDSSTRAHLYNITKVRGLSIKKLGAKKLVNLEKIVDLVLSKERDNSFNLHSKVVKKNYSLIFDKCVLKVDQGYMSFPYGYKS